MMTSERIPISIHNPPKPGDLVELSLKEKGPFTVSHMGMASAVNTPAIFFTDRSSSWAIYETIEQSRCWLISREIPFEFDQVGDTDEDI